MKPSTDTTLCILTKLIGATAEDSGGTESNTVGRLWRRKLDVAAVEAALRESRLVTVVGPGGVGKTRLVTAVAERAAPRFPAGGAFVDLVPVRTGTVAGAVVQAVADALDVTVGPTQSVERAVLERLHLGRPLLVLDNCEHVIDEVGALTERGKVTSASCVGLEAGRSPALGGRASFDAMAFQLVEAGNMAVTTAGGRPTVSQGLAAV